MLAENYVIYTNVPFAPLSTMYPSDPYMMSSCWHMSSVHFASSSVISSIRFMRFWGLLITRWQLGRLAKSSDLQFDETFWAKILLVIHLPMGLSINDVTSNHIFDPTPYSCPYNPWFVFFQFTFWETIHEIMLVFTVTIEEWLLIQSGLW